MEGADPGDVGAEVPVDAGAVDTDQDPVGQGGPARATGTTLSTPVSSS